MRHILIILAAVNVVGCSSNPRVENLSSADRAALASITVHQGGVERAHKIIGTVDGLSCNRNKYQAQDISDHEALEGVKIKAAQLGANAVINTFCQTNSDTDWGNNCWASVKCVGDAVVYTD